MRPLPQLDSLSESPSVFQQPTDDWNSIFAEDFTSMASQQSGADQQSNIIFPAMDPLSQAIDALGGILDDATSILGTLSGDLDLVDLVPQILEYQSSDTALATSLDSFTIDTTGISTFFASFATSLVDFMLNNILVPIVDFVNQLVHIGNGILSEPDQRFIAVFG